METPLTGNIDPRRAPLDLADYERAGGYRAARKALQELAPAEIVEQVARADLRGRGGAGFPAGVKWRAMPALDAAPRPRYLAVNADEMEPGTFKDRVLLEGDPHQMIEAVIVTSYAVAVDVAYIFLRGEYQLAERRLRAAIAQAYERGYLGKRIFGSGYDLELHLHVSAGRYICGEGGALLNALEGRRAIPRREIFSMSAGLWGRPTLVNNVETLCNVPHIVLHGAEWFRDLGRNGATGSKIYGVSGPVQRPGWWELPLGTSMRELLEEHAGGMLPGRRFRGLLPGGASTEFVLDEHLDTPMDFDAVPKVGSRMGTGTMIVLDDGHCPVGMLHNLEAFFARESCGWCTPCREGLPWTAELLAAIEAGSGRPEDIDILLQLCERMGPGRTYCMLAPGAVEPLQSALKYFRADFDRHIREGRCPWDHTTGAPRAAAATAVSGAH